MPAAVAEPQFLRGIEIEVFGEADQFGHLVYSLHMLVAQLENSTDQPRLIAALP